MLHRLIRISKRTPGSALLDVACGTGSHLVFLGEHYEVEGLDIDEAMLDIARSKLPQVPLHHGDMLELSLPRAFDVVVCLFSSIAYVRTAERLKQAIARMALHVLPGGVLIIEPWFSPEGFKGGIVHASFVDQPGLKIARMNVSEVADLVSILQFHFLVATTLGVEYLHERHELGLFDHSEYVVAFQDAGLSVVHDERGLEGRGLYIGTKQLPPKA